MKTNVTMLKIIKALLARSGAVASSHVAQPNTASA